MVRSPGVEAKDARGWGGGGLPMERRGLSHRGMSLTMWGPGWKFALLMISIGPRAARPAVMRARGPVLRVMGSSMHLLCTVRNIVRAGWALGRMRVKSEEAIGIHSGWVRVTPRLSFGGDSPGASHRRHLLPQTACLAVICSRHGIAPKPPCRGVPMRRVEGTPGGRRRLGVLRGGCVGGLIKGAYRLILVPLECGLKVYTNRGR